MFSYRFILLCVLTTAKNISSRAVDDFRLAETPYFTQPIYSQHYLLVTAHFDPCTKTTTTTTTNQGFSCEHRTIAKFIALFFLNILVSFYIRFSIIFVLVVLLVCVLFSFYFHFCFVNLSVVQTSSIYFVLFIVVAYLLTVFHTKETDKK